MEFEVTKGKQKSPYKIMIYGPAGIGKTSLAFLAPKTLILDIEGGSAKLDVESTRIETLGRLRSCLMWAAKNSEYDTYVFDTMTWIENFLVTQILTDNNWKTLAQGAYGQGAVALYNEWVSFLKCIDYLNRHGKNVIFLAHSRIKTFASPNTENYDRYEPELMPKAIPYIMSVFDAVLFYHPKTVIKQLDGKNPADKGAIAGQRQLLTVDKVHALAKNRFGLPEYIPVPQGTDGGLFKLLY